MQHTKALQKRWLTNGGYLDKDESTFLRHIPCENCGSSDANSLYSDNHQFCFSCNTHVQGDGSCSDVPTKRTKAEGLIQGSYQDLSKRLIREDTCRKFGYQVGENRGKTVHIAPYFDAAGNNLDSPEFVATGATKQVGKLYGGMAQVISRNCLSLEPLPEPFTARRGWWRSTK